MTKLSKDILLSRKQNDPNDFSGTLTVKLGSGNDGMTWYAGNDSTEGGFGNDDNAACSSPTRAFVFGSGNMTNVIQFVTISTRGDSQDFGDLTQGNVRFPAGLSSNTRGVSGGGRQPSP